MIGEIKYEKYGNLDIFKSKKTIGVFTTRNNTEYSFESIKKIILKYRDSTVFYFTYDFYLRTGLYRVGFDFLKVVVTESKFLHHNLVKNSNAQLVLNELPENKKLSHLIKDLVILNFVRKIIILEATKFSKNLKVISEIASGNSIDVFCLPGRLSDSSSYGTNKIIFDGAIPLFDFDLLSG